MAADSNESSVRDGVRAGLPLVLPVFAVAVSFGVLARPVMGALPAVVMSIVVFAGAAQFASLSVLAAGGTAGAAIVAGLLMNARFLPMGFAAALLSAVAVSLALLRDRRSSTHRGDSRAAATEPSTAACCSARRFPRRSRGSPAPSSASSPARASPIPSVSGSMRSSRRFTSRCSSASCTRIVRGSLRHSER